MKKLFKGVLVAGALVLGLGACGAMVTEEEETVVKPQKEEPKKEEVVANIGDTLKVGDTEFTINGTSQAQNVGGEYGYNAQGTYLLIDMSVTNRGNESMYVDGDMFKLKVDGKTYDSDSSATIYANENDEFFMSDINPDITMTGKIAFDLPAELLEKELVLEVSDAWFGGNTGQINLK